MRYNLISNLNKYQAFKCKMFLIPSLFFLQTKYKHDIISPVGYNTLGYHSIGYNNYGYHMPPINNALRYAYPILWEMIS